MIKPYVFATSQDSLTTYVFVNQDGKYTKKYVYIPTIFEQMSQSQIQSYKRRYNLKFLIWTVTNRDKFHSLTDYRVSLSRFIDLNTNTLISLFSVWSLRQFFSRLESPFLDFYFEDKPIKLPAIKRATSLLIGGYLFYSGVKSILSLDYIFDLGLEYKEYICPGELVSENCESALKKIRA